MKPLEIAPEAANDLRSIALYIAEDNPDRADSFVDELRAKALRIAQQPLSYRARNDISPGLRSATHGRYLLLFRDLPDRVRVVRVVHAARDLGRLSDL